VQRYRCFGLATVAPTQLGPGFRQFCLVSTLMGPLWLAPACSSSLAFNCPSAQSLTTYTCAATDCHLRCNCLFWLHIHVSVLVPFVYGVRDAAAVDSGHREDIRDAERAEVRRQLEASDCARTKDCTLILNRYRRDNTRPTNERTTLRSAVAVTCTTPPRKSWGGGRSFRRCRRFLLVPRPHHVSYLVVVMRTPPTVGEYVKQV
jgi:hypothetical protein